MPGDSGRSNERARGETVRGSQRRLIQGRLAPETRNPIVAKALRIEATFALDLAQQRKSVIPMCENGQKVGGRCDESCF